MKNRDSVERSRRVPTNASLLRGVVDDYNPPVTLVTRSMIFKGLFFFDKLELFLLCLSWVLTDVIFVPIIHESMISPPLITFWGILSIGMFTFRHSSSSIFHFIIQRQAVQEKMKKGEYVPEFKLIGFLISLVLSFFPKMVSIFLIWTTRQM